ncbi:hypothetical protein L227DRAFT_618130, partial [Lentinus tigrinus ALCF2SS1-6]
MSQPGSSAQAQQQPNDKDSRWMKETWREGIFTFCGPLDNAGMIPALFTVTNLPLDFELPMVRHEIPDNNLSAKTLRHVQYAHRACPEIAYVLHKVPMNDPLIARLGPNPSLLCPVKYDNGFALHHDVQWSWWQLERGLLLISEILLSLDATPEG